MIEQILKFSKEKAKALYDLNEDSLKMYSDIEEINCNDIPEEAIQKNIVEMEKFKKLFELLNSITQPVIYMFEITSNHGYIDVEKALKSYKDSNVKSSGIIMKTPPLKNNSEAQKSKVLYIGKRQQGGSKAMSNIAGRMIHHFGLYTREGKEARELIPSTSGLQLIHWAGSLNLKVKITIIAFPSELNELLSFFENSLSKKLHPILGEHRY